MSTDSRLLLVKTITLLYRESLIEEKTDHSADLVRTVLEEIKLPEMSLSLNHEREYLMAMKDTALYLCTQVSEGLEIDRDDLLQRLKVNCNQDEKLYDAFVQGIERDLEERVLKRTILSIRKYLNDHFRDNELVKMVTTASKDILFKRSTIKHLGKYVRDLIGLMEPYTITSKRNDPAILETVDLGDEIGLAETFTKIQDTESSATILKTGWKGINRMLQGGFRKGEAWVLGALQHSFKTGMSLTIFKQIAIYNTPVLKNPKKKPMLLRISFEDSTRLNVQFLYQNFYENEFGKKANLREVTPAQMASYVKSKMEATGYKVRLMRVNPSEWTYKDIQNTVLELEAEGYEIHVLMLDYLPMIPTTGCESGPIGHDIQDLYKRMRNFCSARDTLLFTPHQLSSDAKNMRREGQRDFVKKMVGGGYYRGAKGIDQEVDGELFAAIEKLNGKAYLTVQRGKHRIPTIIPDSEQYIVLPFPVEGSIPDDLLLETEITLKAIGGGAIGSKDETPFFAYDALSDFTEEIRKIFPSVKTNKELPTIAMPEILEINKAPIEEFVVEEIVIT